MSHSDGSKGGHFTLRPGFALGTGFFVLALYFLWAAYGAAPTSLSFLAEEPGEAPAVTPMAGMDAPMPPTEGMTVTSMAMAAHGVGVGGMTPEEFEEITYRFIDELSLPDGSVRPSREWTERMRAAGVGGGKAAHDEGEAPHAAGDEAQGAGEAAHDEEEPVDVYLMAMRFTYAPKVLRLERGVPYRFRIMSMDVNHGVSIHTGFAGHIMRRPARVLTEMVMTFKKPGDYMMYCTVFCGLGHDRMKGKIIVE